MSLSGYVALWVMQAPGLEKEEECVEQKTNYLWFCCVDPNHLFSNMSVMSPTVLSEPRAYITHNAA